MDDGRRMGNYPCWRGSGQHSEGCPRGSRIEYGLGQACCPIPKYGDRAERAVTQHVRSHNQRRI